MSEVIGWRGWRLRRDADGPVLVSVTRSTHWPGPVLAADRRPTEANAHGIYALVAREDDDTSGHLTSAGVFGEVALSGRVVVGELGYRAEHAVIRSLYLNPPSRVGRGLRTEEPAAIVAALEARYGVEVQVVPWPDHERVAYEMVQASTARMAAAIAKLREAMAELATQMQVTDLACAMTGPSVSLLVGRLSRCEIRHDRPTRHYYHDLGSPIVGASTERFTMEGDVMRLEWEDT